MDLTIFSWSSIGFCLIYIDSLLVAWYIFLHSLTCNLSEFLNLRWVSGRQHIVGSCAFATLPVSFNWLIWTLTFKVIIDNVGLKYHIFHCLLNVLHLFFVSLSFVDFYSFSIFSSFNWEFSMTHFSLFS